VTTEPTKPRGLFGRLFGTAAPAPAPAPDLEPELVPEPTPEPAQAPVVEPNPSTPAMTASDVAALDTAPNSAPDSAPTRGSWLQRLKSGLAQTSAKLTEGITSVFTKRKLDAATLDDLEDLLLQADLGLATSERIATTLKATRYEKTISPDEVREVLAAEVQRVLTPVAIPLQLRADKKPHVMLFVGVNGTGKTTTIGKLAAKYRRDGRQVVIAAGDTFRAAAVEQLKVWGDRAGATVISRPTGSDAAGLAYDALLEAQKAGADVLMIDTAGRLQNKAQLMDELEKVIRVLRKVDPQAPHDVVLVLDATTGQNALNQVEVFKDKAGVTGLVMTKLDGTARGGILVAISAKFQLPVHAIGVGEGIDDLEAFDPAEFARAIAFG
jgi:fused signal recognition particle receptor